MYILVRIIIFLVSLLLLVFVLGKQSNSKSRKPIRGIMAVVLATTVVILFSIYPVEDLFVSFYYDADSKRIFQMAAHGEAYVLDSSSSDYYLWEEEIPQGSILIDRYQAEEIEDSWRTMSETGGTDKLS